MLPNGRPALPFDDDWLDDKDRVFFQMAGLKLAIVGSATLTTTQTAAASHIVMSVLQAYKPCLVISGGASGVDTLAENYAHLYGIERKIFHPAGSEWRFFRERNLLIARECDALVRVVIKNSKTYGSGWTRDRAKEMGKPTREFVID